MSTLATLPTTRKGKGVALDWMPDADVVEDKDEYIIALELPGVKRDDVNLTLENGTLYVSGERRTPHGDENFTRHLGERSFGRFERRFRLPDIAETEKVNASMNDGVLTVNIAKREIAKPRQIEISTK